jgi:hypothetical protein
MANFRRKQCKRRVRCTMCTQHRWLGNTSGRRPDHALSDNRDRQKIRKAVERETTQ